MKKNKNFDSADVVITSEERSKEKGKKAIGDTRVEIDDIVGVNTVGGVIGIKNNEENKKVDTPDVSKNENLVASVAQEVIAAADNTLQEQCTVLLAKVAEYQLQIEALNKNTSNKKKMKTTKKKHVSDVDVFLKMNSHDYNENPYILVFNI